MRILVLNPFEITAATTFRMEQLSRVIATENEIVFVSYGNREERFKREGIEYILFKKRFASPWFHFHQMWLKLLACMKEDYEILYVSKPLPWALFPAVFACALRRKRLLLDWDEHEQAIVSRISKNKFYTGIIGLIERCAVRRADGLVVVSPYLMELALKWGCDKKDIALVQNGVDLKGFRSIEQKETLKKKLNLKGKLVMFLGSLRPQFDIDLLIKAMPLVKKDVRDAKLIIVGGGSERANLENLAKREGLGDITFFLGQQPHELVPSLVNMADVVVAPNRKNGMNLSRSPVKIAEYMAIGTPVVANAVGLAEEMLKDDAGELVYSESPEEMAEKIVGILKNRKKANEIAAKAKARVVKLYTWERLGGELERFIEKKYCDSKRI